MGEAKRREELGLPPRQKNELNKDYRVSQSSLLILRKNTYFTQKIQLLSLI